MVEFNGEEVAYDGKQRFDLDLAYATTVTSIKVLNTLVFVPIVSSHSHMLSRNLIYTAIHEVKNKFALLDSQMLLSVQPCIKILDGLVFVKLDGFSKLKVIKR